MRSAKQLENLKKGKNTRFHGEMAAENQRKATESRKRNTELRKLGLMFMNSTPDVSAATLQQLKQLGVKDQSPTLQMIMVARLGALIMSKDTKVAMQAMQMLMEITGTDSKSQTAAEKHRIERERLALEREKMERESACQDDGERVNITILPTGGIEVDNGQDNGDDV